jgi:hypothetical protein
VNDDPYFASVPDFRRERLLCPGPVRQDDDGRSVFDWSVDEKTLAVGGDVVLGALTKRFVKEENPLRTFGAPGIRLHPAVFAAATLRSCGRKAAAVSDDGLGRKGGMA